MERRFSKRFFVAVEENSRFLKILDDVDYSDQVYALMVDVTWTKSLKHRHSMQVS